MLTTALVLFALGALGGLIMAVRIFNNQTIPAILAVGHGLLVASGLILLLIDVLNGVGGTIAQISLGVLLVAALGGFYLLTFHIRKSAHPRGMVVIHALAAVVGVGCLVAAAMGS